MPTTLQRPLRGIIPPLVTPLLDNDTLDLEGLRRLIDHTIAGGVHGVFVLGTTGEFASLSYRIRIDLIEKTCELVNGRVPVLVGIADSAFMESLNLARIAEKSGASAVVITPPYYYTSGQPELTDFFTRLMAKMPLPLFVYNMPQHAKVSVDPETVKVAAEIPGVIGIKDSSGNLTYLNKVMHLLKDRTDFTFMIGPEEILAEFVLLGGHGGINGGANMFPKLYVGLYDAAVNRDFKRIHVLRDTVLQISSTLYGVGHHGSSYLKGIKCVLSIMGICSDFMAEPFRKFKEPERAKIMQHLKDLKYEELL